MFKILKWFISLLLVVEVRSEITKYEPVPDESEENIPPVKKGVIGSKIERVLDLDLEKETNVS